MQSLCWGVAGRAGGSLASCHSLLGELQANETPGLKGQGGQCLSDGSQRGPPHVCGYTDVCTLSLYTHMYTLIHAHRRKTQKRKERDFGCRHPQGPLPSEDGGRNPMFLLQAKPSQVPRQQQGPGECGHASHMSEGGDFHAYIWNFDFSPELWKISFVLQGFLHGTLP